MKCQCCGEEVKIGERFCRYCYNPIEYDLESQKLLEEEQAKLEKRKKNKKTKNKIIKSAKTVLSLVLVFFIGFTIFYDKGAGEFNTTKVEEVANILTEYQESHQNHSVEPIEVQQENKVKVPLNMGESLSSKSYEVTLLDVDIVDKNYENAILYTFHSGEEYAFVKLSLTNLLYEDAIYSSLFNFSATCDGKEILESKSGTLGEGNKFISIDGKNERRQTKMGFLCYSVPENWKVIEVKVNIDGIDNEPKLIVENPKNRVISQVELEQIIEKCNVKEVLKDANLRPNDDELYKVITDFMHLNCLSKTDYVPPQGLSKYIQEQLS